MKKSKALKNERQINNVLAYHAKELAGIHFPSKDIMDESINNSIALLQEMGITPSVSVFNEKFPEYGKSVLGVRTWEELCLEAEHYVGTQCNLESIFTEEELKTNELAIHQLNEDFNMLHRLDKFDVTISALAGIIGATVDIVLVGVPQKSKTGLKAGVLADYIRDYFDRKFPEEEMRNLANSKVSKVPYDAQDNRNTKIRIEGLSAYYHRLLQLGHDPLLGFVFGVADILTGRMTTIDKEGNIVSQVMENYADRTETDVFSALAKQLIHFKSDVTTSMGLPVPLMGLFNLLQFGCIGEEEQTIAEIVQGMYYEGYDFIHFCSMSVSAMLVEIVVRLGYAMKCLKEGNSVKDSLPISSNRKKHPKLETMLFISHAGAVAANAGKVYFTKNPMAINYPEWLAFAKYSYGQLRWSLIQKPAMREAYVLGKINEELKSVLDEVDNTFNDFSSEYTVIFH